MGKRKGAGKPQKTGTTSQAQINLSDIPPEEQWRLVNDSGILDGLDAKNTRILRRGDDEDTDSLIGDDEPLEEASGDLADEVFHAILLIVPMSFIYILMDMYVDCLSAL